MFVYSLFLGECTNPLLNLWTITKKNKSSLFPIVNHTFVPIYILFRGVLIPIYFTNSLSDLYYNNEVSKLDYSVMCFFSLFMEIFIIERLL